MIYKLFFNKWLNLIIKLKFIIKFFYLILQRIYWIKNVLKEQELIKIEKKFLLLNNKSKAEASTIMY